MNKQAPLPLRAAIAAILGSTLATASMDINAQDLERMSLQELSELEVTSVFKRPEPLASSPAAVYVITQDEIRRSGAVSLPEALRLAPNLQVARLDAASYAISARGFNTYQASNKLLVLIDGRSVYTPLHAGVYWDQQQVLLQDIERIEVISGPGGTLWGANAVNGVINIITRAAWHTDGAAVDLRAGTLDSSASARFGDRAGNIAYRVYGMGFERGDTLDIRGDEAADAWDGVQGGFRTDWQDADNSVTVQGDLFENSFRRGEISGGNAQAQWTHTLHPSAAVELQIYYDEVHREVDSVLDELETFDADLQHRFEVGDHQVVWGGGHRVTHDRFANRLNAFVLVPESETVQLSNAFVQVSSQLRDDTTLTYGSKFEYSSYTGLEFLPSVRVAWQLSGTKLLWTAVSRAVRTPSRIDRELVNPGILEPARDFDSERVVAYEAGYRGHPTTDVSLSLSIYYNDYERLRMLTVTPGGRFRYANAMAGETYGLEIWAEYQVSSWWRLSAGLNLLEKDLEFTSNSVPLVLFQHAGNDPEEQYSLRSTMNITPRVEFDLAVRAVDELPTPAVPSYVEIDARLGWQLPNGLELSIAGFNLLDRQHFETGDPLGRRAIRRSGHVELMWKFE